MKSVDVASDLSPTLGELTFSQTQARAIVKDLFEPNPAIYWADFLLSISGGAIAFGLVPRMPLFSWQQGALFIVSSLLYFRAALFIHELVHLRNGTFRLFRVTWNALCGIPFLIPSFVYLTHVDHHRRKHYGTHEDGEYIALGTQSPWAIVKYLLLSLVVPLLAVLRFGLITPICWFSPRLRDWTARRASSMVMDPGYVRPLPTRRTRRIWRRQELFCFLYLLGMAVLLIIAGLRRDDGPRLFVLGPWFFLGHAYLTSVFIVTLNAIRTVGAHRFLNTGGQMTFIEQLLDSVNYPSRPWITSLWGPLGLRYHALHHLFPSMPYHNMGEAHRRLMAQLPADSPYRLTICPSLTAGVLRVWRNAAAAQAARRRGDAAPQLAGAGTVDASPVSAGQ